MEGIITVTAVLAILAALFLIFRKIVLWYFRINEVVDRLDNMVGELKKISTLKA